jgi:hypothetical protein
MKRKSRKHNRKYSAKRVRKTPASSRRKIQTKRKSSRKIPRHQLVPKNARRPLVYQKALAVLARMRRDRDSLATAARKEHIKQNTVLRYVGNALYRRGPGKPWKPTKTDRFSARMTILTAQGPTTVQVRGSLERTRLARYDIALRKWRAGEDGADKELMAFEGQTVGGHVLITDPNLLIHLEEAGQLDFDTLYFSVGGGR